MTEGYSGTPLFKKLGIKPASRLRVLHAPAHYRELLTGMPVTAVIVQQDADMIHAFYSEKALLERELPVLADEIPKDGMIWVSWPKKSSGLPTDITEDVIRGVALGLGLVDVKVCAVDGVWSGLKLVWRLTNR
ncbi:DUF3052 domain-containing protein [Chitinophaga deserti]|uniref:DUF3052 domain-containing protein n=1 Tax=Chitinophaga deserti TaxID=2164099 RepID=UPI000D6C0D57|nr:DUF3052 domain-containing protein [Chitinophaga deserti]